VAKTDFKTVDEYINTFPQDVGETLEKIRQTIQEAVPDAEEVISYQIPAFKFYGWILYFSAYKDHYSISFPPPSTVFDIFKKELSEFEISKSAIQFPKNKPIPFELIGKIAKLRMKENLDRDKTKTKDKKK
jgi:uncharacterized protein YdhG (YjbR/CyaY superfamily)